MKEIPLDRDSCLTLLVLRTLMHIGFILSQCSENIPDTGGEKPKVKNIHNTFVYLSVRSRYNEDAYAGRRVCPGSAEEIIPFFGTVRGVNMFDPS